MLSTGSIIIGQCGYEFLRVGFFGRLHEVNVRRVVQHPKIEVRGHIDLAWIEVSIVKSVPGLLQEFFKDECSAIHQGRESVGVDEGADKDQLVG